MAVFGDMLQEYYVQKFTRMAKVRRRRMASLQTPEDVRRYQQELRQKLAEAWRFPQECGPLRPRIVGVLDFPEYIIEKVIFDSRPDFPVCCSLYLPKRRRSRCPGILELLGHAPDGKSCPEYQAGAIALCRRGCVVLLPDPIGQGERTQYPEHPEIFNCREHNLLNRRMLPLGDCFGAWRLHDARRCLDYLLTRPEVDSRRLGVMGNSGGGTMTTLLNAVDERLSAAAPNCYITRWWRNVENELPVDAEQIPFGMAADGGDMADLLLVAAPRPVLISGEKNDFFDIRGTREVFAEVQRIYTILGYPERVQLWVGEGSHGFNLAAREQTYKFFQQCFSLPAVSPREEPWQAVPKEQLDCFPAGQVSAYPGARNISAFLAEDLQRLQAARGQRSPAELRQALRRKLGIAAVRVPHYRQLRPIYVGDGRLFARYALQSEPGILTTLCLAADNQSFFHLPAAERTELYIPHQDSKSELQKRVLQPGELLFGLDYRGVGESTPAGCDQTPTRDFFQLYQFDYHYDSLSQLLGESYLGGRVRDILAAIKLLRQAGNQNIILTAAGIGKIPALLVAFLSPGKVKLALPEDSGSYAEQVLKECNDWPQSMHLKGILEITDLPEILQLC